MTETHRTLAGLKAIPKEKLADKIRKTVLGIGLAALGVWVVRIGATSAPVSLWLIGGGVGLCLLGATAWSGELVLSPFKLLGAAVVDLWRQVKGPPA